MIETSLGMWDMSCSHHTSQHVAHLAMMSLTYATEKRSISTSLTSHCTCSARFSRVAGLEGCSPLELILRLMEGVARKEGYRSEDLLLRIVGWKGLLTRAVKVVGWNVKPSPSHVELPICSGVSLQVSWSMLARSDLGIKICSEGPSFLHCAHSADFLRPQFCTVNKKNNYIAIPSWSFIHACVMFNNKYVMCLMHV